MARKSNNLDKKMIEAGIKLLKKHGAASLSVRDVANEAGANLGMFAYHFGTKDKFILRALNEIYLGFLADLGKANDESGDLNDVLFQIATFSRDHREILTAILSDVLSNDRVVTSFLRKNFSKHFVLLRSTLDAHLRKRSLSLSNPHHAVRFLLGAVGIPNILLEVHNRGARRKEPADTDAELRMRIKAAILGLEATFCMVTP